MKFGTLDFQNNSKVVVYFSSRNLTPKRWLTLDCENENFFFFVNFCFTFIVTGEVKNRYYYLFWLSWLPCLKDNSGKMLPSFCFILGRLSGYLILWRVPINKRKIWLIIKCYCLFYRYCITFCKKTFIQLSFYRFYFGDVVEKNNICLKIKL